MRLILSRKGFDSSSGGCPNPIFPDGTLLALPIPDARSTIRYRDVAFSQGQGTGDLGALVNQLTNGRVKPAHGAHLDPDVDFGSYPRQPGWRPLFGQMGAAQGHLSRQGVGEGDLFLFFGVFRDVERHRRRWRFRPESRPHHRIWGWFQVGVQLQARDLPDETLGWAGYHPHCNHADDANNCLYVASEELALSGVNLGRPGAGHFAHISVSFLLSDPDERLPSVWKLPPWFYPSTGRRPLSYHQNRERWSQRGDSCSLASVFRGQEFVLQGEDYPQAAGWAAALVSRAGG